MISRIARLPLLAFAILAATLSTFAREVTPIVSYAPGLTIVEGDQPLSTTFVLSITAPSSVQRGNPVTITPQVTILGKPADISDTIALSYVTLTPPTLVFTAPGQTLTTVVTAHFPEGTVAGEYAYKIMTPGWAPGTQDGGAFINATVFPQRRGDVPVVDITTPLNGATFVYQPAVGPLSVPVQFNSAAPVISPITAIDADVSSVALALNTVGHGDGSFTSSGTAVITSPGLYTIRARATNALGTATDTVEFNVVVDAPPPTVSISLPAPGSVFNLPESGALSAPYSFTALSAFGGITSLTATLNGLPFSFTPAGLGTTLASGSGNFSLTASGSYELVVTATNAYGTASARTSFTVNAFVPTPAPTVSIAQPLDGAIFTRVAGSAPTSIPFSYTGVAGQGYTITALTGTLNGNPVTATLTGMGTATATGTGTLSVNAPGTYTLTAAAASGTATAATSVTFTVIETTPPAPTCGVNWLPPISLGKVQKGGSMVAIKFELDCGCEHGVDRTGDGDPDFYPGQRTKSKANIDPSIIVAVSEIFADESVSTPMLFVHGPGSPNVPTYTIQGNDMYHLNFPAARGSHAYRIEVYQFPNGSTTPVVIGTREFTTK